MRAAMGLGMKHILNTDFTRTLALLLFVFSPAGWAAEFSAGAADSWLQEEDDFLPVDEAFVLSAEVAPDGSIVARRSNWNRCRYR